MNEIHESNRAFWNSMAAGWEKRTDERGLWDQCHREPTLVLSPGEMRYLSDVDRKAICVLGSGDNEVVFALAGMGAKVTSLDISEEQLKIAEKRAASLGLAVSFLRADVTDLSVLDDEVFDVVYSGGHVSVWISDLKKFYAEAVRILKPGGLFIVNEYHPFRRVWHDEVQDLELCYDYFNRGPFEYKTDQGLPQIEYHWTVADHISAVMEAGCELMMLEEHGNEYDEWRKIDLRRLPEYILIVGRKCLTGEQPYL